MVLITSKQKNSKIFPWSLSFIIYAYLHECIQNVLISVNGKELRVLRLRHILNFPYIEFNL